MALFPSRNPQEYIRVLKLASKPSLDEQKVVAAVAGVGLCAVGLLGTLIYEVMQYLPL